MIEVSVVVLMNMGIVKNGSALYTVFSLIFIDKRDFFHSVGLQTAPFWTILSTFENILL